MEELFKLLLAVIRVYLIVFAYFLKFVFYIISIPFTLMQRKDTLLLSQQSKEKRTEENDSFKENKDKVPKAMNPILKHGIFFIIELIIIIFALCNGYKEEWHF